VQIAEAWFDNDRALPVQDGGLGFDLTLDDRLRLAVRAVLAQAAGGASIPINLDGLRDALRSLWGYPYPWQSVQHLENHDIVDADRQNPSETQPRIAKLADWNDPRSWYARSRSRVATGILMTAPGVPMLFMGEEFLEFKPWHNNQNTSGYAIDWDGLDGPAPNPVMGDFHRFITDLIWLRRRHPGLRGRGCNPYFNHNDDRVIAIQRWNDVASRDLIAVASFSETTRRDYPLPLPVGGFWMEVFNADAYETMPAGGGLNVNVPGNPGGIQGDGPPLANCPTSARIVLPANGFLVFARDRGDNG